MASVQVHLATDEVKMTFLGDCSMTPALENMSEYVYLKGLVRSLCCMENSGEDNYRSGVGDSKYNKIPIKVT